MILTVAYGGVGVVGFMGYIPTIIGLFKGKPCADLNSYVIWSITGLVGLLYSIFILKDLLVIAISTMNVSSCVLIAALTVYVKLKYKNTAHPD